MKIRSVGDFGRHRKCLPLSFCAGACAPHCGLFPVADRPGCRRIGPCLQIKRHYQESPCAGVLHEWFASPIAGAEAHVPLSARLRSVRTRNSADAHRTSTAERHKGRASQASSVPPASHVCVSGIALPPVSYSGVPLPDATALLTLLYVPLPIRSNFSYLFSRSIYVPIPTSTK